jgi:hypothetical protein
MNGDDLAANHLAVLRQRLSTLGATPADRSRVPAGDDGESNTDPTAVFFHS